MNISTRSRTSPTIAMMAPTNQILDFFFTSMRLSAVKEIFLDEEVKIQIYFKFLLLHPRIFKEHTTL
ncbi:hypothetical protein HZA26_03230 [Candidatus Nomurabacteria bacterium]|nr:hypothetical protein [Candidatus Nomurabacteria bacterium]